MVTGHRSQVTSRGLRILATGAAAATLVLILAGGFVTTTATGDTIPEWPLSWGRLIPPSFGGGIAVEWTHRVLAGAVALLVAALAIWTQLAERRPWVRRLALAALAAVVIQALIGGLRIYVPGAAVAIVHACFAQLVFCAVTAVALAFSRAWAGAREDARAASAARLGVVTAAFAFLQLVAGAVTRHTGAGIAVHLVGAGLVLLHAGLFASRLAATSLRRSAVLLAAALVLQLLLGFAAWGIRSSGFVRSHEAPVVPLAIVTLHVAVGALVLAQTLVLTLRAFRAAPAAAALPAPEPVHP